MKTLRFFAIFAALVAGSAFFASCQKDDVTGTLVLGKDTYKIVESMWFEMDGALNIDYHTDGEHTGFNHDISKGCIGKEIDLAKHFSGGTFSIGLNPPGIFILNDSKGISSSGEEGSPFKSGTLLIKKSGDDYIMKAGG